MFILPNISLPAWTATSSGLNGDNPFAISSAFTNSLQFNKSGRMFMEAVVFPAPLGPAIIYSIDFKSNISLIIYQCKFSANS